MDTRNQDSDYNSNSSRLNRRKGARPYLFLDSCNEDASLPDSVKIDIQDSGIGIPFEIHERIFDPFYTTKEPGIGTGLGLSIAARIVDSYDGRITVRSEPGNGSCFTVWLPATERTT
jgi:signal transduction histidine kinase